MTANELILVIVSCACIGAFMYGMPIVLCMGLWIVAVSYFADVLPLSNVGQSAFFGLKIFALLAMPLFILTGDLIRASGIAQRLTEFASASLRFFPGNTAVSTIAASGFFAAISGSNSATAATMGRIMIPEMVRRGYDKIFAAATAASGGTVGVIIPPSLIFIIYGILLRVSPGDLFIAGILPGILMVVSMMFVAAYLSWRNGWEAPTPMSGSDILRTAWRAKLGFLGMFIALGGIYSGIFSPTEVAGAVVIYALVAGLLFTSELKWRQLPAVFLDSAMVNGLIAPIVAFSLILQETFVAVGFPQMVASVLGPLATEAWIAILICMAVVLIAGCVLESVPNVIIWAPILAPLAAHTGVDPIHFAIIFCVGDAIGFITPPYGLNLYVTAGVTGYPYMQIAMRALPYLAALMVAWVIIAIFPALSLVLLPK
jgi:C4-dicarboxylate transporter, DctM subunit